MLFLLAALSLQAFAADPPPNHCAAFRLQCELTTTDIDNAPITVLKAMPPLSAVQNAMAGEPPKPPGPPPACNYSVSFSKEETHAGVSLHAQTNLSRKLEMYAVERHARLQPEFATEAVGTQKSTLTHGNATINCWLEDSTTGK